ncbi:MAG: MotA/TolQ/ExbB proton channel family protein [Burkholderiaceae bacterium]
MSQLLEQLMYQVGQVFLIPTLVAISILFLYSLYALGAFAVAYLQRKGHVIGAQSHTLRSFELLRWAQAHPGSSGDDLDVAAHRLLEVPRVTTRVTPMLGLVATMIPMGPALKALSDGNLASVSENLAIAFSAVILALIAAAITYWIVSIKRRWLAEELAWLQAAQAAGSDGRPA